MAQATASDTESEDEQTNPIFRFSESLLSTNGVNLYEFEFNLDIPSTGDYDADIIRITHHSVENQFQAEYSGIGGSQILQTEVLAETLIVHNIPFFSIYEEIISYHALHINITRLISGGYLEDDVADCFSETSGLESSNTTSHALSSSDSELENEVSLAGIRHFTSGG